LRPSRTTGPSGLNVACASSRFSCEGTVVTARNQLVRRTKNQETVLAQERRAPGDVSGARPARFAEGKDAERASCWVYRRAVRRWQVTKREYTTHTNGCQMVVTTGCGGGAEYRRTTRNGAYYTTPCTACQAIFAIKSRCCFAALGATNSDMASRSLRLFSTDFYHVLHGRRASEPALSWSIIRPAHEQAQVPSLCEATCLAYSRNHWGQLEKPAESGLRGTKPLKLIFIRQPLGSARTSRV
jgi:hypothetical protein